MPESTTKCDPDRLNRFAAEQLDAKESRWLETHIEQCESCRIAIQRDSAGDEWWTEASDFLTDDETDLMSLSTMLPRHADTLLADQVDQNAHIDAVLKWLGPSDDPQRLGRVGTYEISGVIGSGGMGVVLKGFDSALNRFVAIKVLSPHLATGGAARKRFAREAQAAAAVVHESVIAIHGVAEVNGLPYLVMPYERGKSLQKRIDDGGPLSVSEILRVGMQAAAGLAAAHAQGLIHRDVKPANILLAEGVERVTLTDFGLARAADDATITHTGFIAGTPQYMSPEQVDGRTIDHRSDLFSLGSVLYAMCTGRPPFRAESSYGLLKRVVEVEPDSIQELNPEIPVWLVRIVTRLHEKDRDQRFQSSEEVRELLERCLVHTQRPQSEPLPEWLLESQYSKPPSRMKLGGFAAAGLLTAVLCSVPFLKDLAPDNDDSLPIEGATATFENPQLDPGELSWQDDSWKQLKSIEDRVDRLDAMTLDVFEDP